jgi:hypothetical protein
MGIRELITLVKSKGRVELSISEVDMAKLKSEKGRKALSKAGIKGGLMGTTLTLSIAGF